MVAKWYYLFIEISENYLDFGTTYIAFQHPRRNSLASAKEIKTAFVLIHIDLQPAIHFHVRQATPK